MRHLIQSVCCRAWCRILTLSNDQELLLWNTRHGAKVASLPHVQVTRPGWWVTLDQVGAKACLAMDKLGMRFAVVATDKARPFTVMTLMIPMLMVLIMAPITLCFYRPT
jgi:hypothetical protein